MGESSSIYATHTKMEQDVATTNLGLPPDPNDDIGPATSTDITEVEEEWLSPTDSVVEISTQLFMAISTLLILKYAYDRWQDRRRQRIDSNGNNEYSKLHGDNNRRRIDEILQQSVHECPICLADAKFPVLTDCGHIFCCECAFQYWQQSKTIITPCDCAMCRCTIYTLLPVHWPSTDTSEEINDQILKNNLRIDNYNRRFSINRPIMDYIRDIPILIPYLFRSNNFFTVVYQVRSAFVFICVISYVFLPSDIVLEKIYGITGFLDDCIIVLLVIGAVFRWLREYMANRGLVRQQ